MVMRTLTLALIGAVLLGTACSSDRSNQPARASRQADKTEVSVAESKSVQSQATPAAPALAADAEVSASRMAAAPSAPATVAPGGGAQTSDLRPVTLTEADGAQTVAEAFDRKVIRNGEITVELADPAAGQRRIGHIAESHGGFVVTSESKFAEKAHTITMTVRVPSAHFEAAMEEIRGGDGRILHEKITGQDVTEEFIDLDARIRMKRNLEEQYMTIMQQARSIPETMQIQSQIAGVRTEIEQLEGRKRFLANQASLSTLRATLQLPVAAVAVTQDGFFDGVKQAFSDSVDLASAIVLGLIRITGFAIPVAILIGIPLLLLVRIVVRRFGSRSTVASPAAQ
jgi:hypothetical protein